MALAVVAWPRSLHAVAGAPLANDLLQSLRTRAMQSLGHTKKGASPILTLSCIYHTRADPGYYAVLVTIKMFRKLCIPDIAFPLLNGMAIDPAKHHRFGPCGVLLLRLTEIAWAWDCDGWLWDHEGIRIHLLHSPLQLLLTRVRQAWLARVLSLVQSREGFEGLAKVDSVFTTSPLHRMENVKASLLKTTLNGTFYTRDKQFASGRFVDKTCPFCGVHDSLFHRHWECERFQHSRNLISAKVFLSSCSFFQSVHSSMVGSKSQRDSAISDTCSMDCQIAQVTFLQHMRIARMLTFSLMGDASGLRIPISGWQHGGVVLQSCNQIPSGQ